MKPASRQAIAEAEALGLDAPWLHSSFYRFTAVPDPAALAARLRSEGQRGGLTGAILLASEGISGAVAGSTAAVQAFEQALQHPSVLHGALRGVVFKHSHSAVAPFARLKVSVKPELVALGLGAGEGVGTHTRASTAASAPADAGALSPQAWHQLLQRSDVVVLDNRNHFEYRLGHFRNAVDPQVHNFRDFVAYVEHHAPAWRAAGRPVAMYCTGGIRCEKTAPWMQGLGLQVYQLEGGVMAYLQQMAEGEAAAEAGSPASGEAAQTRPTWQGACFVFDNRLALDSRLQPLAVTAEQIYDPRHPDEAWRLQRAQRLHQSALADAAAAVETGDAAGAPASPHQAPDGTPPR